MSKSTLILCTLLCCLQLGLGACGGCTAKYDRDQQDNSTPVQGAMRGPLQGIEVRPQQTTLSASAESTAAYLALMQAITNADEETALQAAEILSKGQGENALPASLWIECGLWFTERKSINAIPFLRTASKAHPDDLALLLLYSEALSEHNFANEALFVLSDYLTRHPGQSDVLLQTGVTQLRNGQPAAALKTFAEISGKGRTGFVEYYQAKALLALGRDHEALVNLRACLKLLPDFGEALALQAFLCEKHDNLKEAIKAYEKLLELKFAPEKDVFLRLTNIALRMNLPTKALEYYNNGPKSDVEYQLLAASLFINAKHYLQAERILKAIAKEPDAPEEVYLFLADLSFMQYKDLALAFAWLNKIADDGDFAQRKLILTAQLQAEAGQIEQALTSIRTASTRFVASPDLLRIEAQILSKAKRYSEAIALMQEGVQRWPDSNELLFLLATLYADNGQKQEAFTTMEEVIKKDQNNYQALNYIGYMLAEQNKDINRALLLLSKANALAPNQFYILDSLAWAHFRAGNLDKAWIYIKEAVRLSPEQDPEILEHYGDIAAAKGLRTEARDGYKKAIRQEKLLQKEQQDLKTTPLATRLQSLQKKLDNLK